MSKDKYYKGQNVRGKILQRTKHPENKMPKGKMSGRQIIQS